MLRDESDWMRFSYASNNLKEFEAKKNGQTVCRLIFKGVTNDDSDIQSAEYFSNGSLIFKQGKGPSGDWFGHVIANGVNVTLSNHPTLAAVKTAMETIRGVEPSLEDYASALQSLSEFEQIVPRDEVEILNQIEDLREQCKKSMVPLEAERARLEREEMARLRAEREERERQRQDQIEEERKARALACNVDISSSQSIERFLSRGLRTEGNGGSTLTYKTLYELNTVGVEIRFDNGKRALGINVRITPGYGRAIISMDFPRENFSGRYFLSSDGTLRSEDGIFTYRCR